MEVGFVRPRGEVKPTGDDDQAGTNKQCKQRSVLLVQVPEKHGRLRSLINSNYLDAAEGKTSSIQKGPPRQKAQRAFSRFILAATYVPTQLPVQYHRPCGA
jgi:hypothetical protein